APFEFAGHDVYSFDREHAQRPRDLAAAKALWGQQLRAEYLQEKLGDKPKEKIQATLNHRHAQQLRTMKALRSDEVLEVYLDALAHVYDPHSDYLGHEQMESFSIAMNLSLFGIGATLESADGYCKIRELVPGGPAARGGLLKAGDRITSVAQDGKDPVDIVNMPLSDAVELIRGPKGSTVTLTILPAGAADSALPKKESIVRDEVKLEDQQAKARILELPNGKGTTLRLGVIDLPSFYADMAGREGAGGRSATADVAVLLGKLKAEHVHGVVLDLRRNGGGSLKEAITLTGLFFRKGPVVQTRDQAGNIEVDADPDPGVLYDGPLVLLTSRFSASASEILAGALQDYGRALIVGDSSTFGKGTVQNVIPLARVMDQAHLAHTYDPGALKITTNKFYRPSGASTQLRGVASDIVLPSISEISGVSESAMKDPLPWDVVRSTPHDNLNRVEPYVSALREKSLRRVSADKDFGHLVDDIARARKNIAAKSISLNEADRRRELAEDKARHEEREGEHRSRHVSQPATYEVTLKNASAPGLTPEDSSKPDIILSESERVLVDYVDLLGRQSRSEALSR
ncbi:MAG: carboxy terminal-processing peptidase, partial [Polyangiaceae bacterium]